jgi:beta-glucosidase
MIAHGVARDTPEVAALAFNAGTDQDMESGAYGLFLSRLVREGKVTAAHLDEGVRRVLRVKYALGLFDNPYGHSSEERERSTLLSPNHIARARDAGRKSIVLLKNSGGVLPLSKKIGSIAVIGPLADDRGDPLGPWDALGRPQDVVTLLEGIRGALPPSAHVLYAQGCAIEGNGTGGIAAALEAAKNADAVVLAVGESSAMSGEAASRSSLDIPGIQDALIEAVAGTGKPVVLVLMNGRPLSITWAEAHIPAILETWFLGVQTGNAVADVLFGDCNPSGKLPVTFPRTVGQVPFYYNHKNTGRPPVDTARFTSRYMDLPSSPLFPFGFGLSYAAFDYSDLTVTPGTIDSAGTVTVAIRVKNTGARAGEEIVQLYVRQDVGSVTRPVRELKGFRRIMLAPGESRQVEFPLPGRDLLMYDAAMRRVVEPGRFTVYVGTNSRDVTEGHFNVRRK